MNFQGGGASCKPAPVRVFFKFTLLGRFRSFLENLFSQTRSLTRYRFENKSPKNFFAKKQSKYETNSSPLAVHSSLINETAFSRFTSHFSLIKPSPFSPLQKPAFTMAEVLITLGVIGIVAAMTLPSVINNARNKQLEAALKKNYSVISQAFEMYYAKNGERATKQLFVGKNFKDNIMPYFNVLKDCGKGLFYTNNKCMPAGSDPYRRYDGTSGFGIYASYFEEGSFILSDGSLIRIYHQNWGNTNCFIAVDVNGFRKNPNRAGFDLFVFELTNDGKLLPVGAPGSSYEYNSNLWDGHVSNTCSRKFNNNGGNGLSCTYKALTDKDYFKNLPK